MSTSYKFEMDSLANILSRRGLESRGRVQQFIDNEVLRKTNPYLPYKLGGITNSGPGNTVIGSGEVQWITPYARRMYYNPQYNFNKSHNPQAGGMWFERMKTAHGKEILAGAASIAGGGADK